MLLTQHHPLPLSDLDAVVARTQPLWEQMRGEQLFITGGTGFFGRWLVESFLHADRELSLQSHVTLLTRDPVAFRARVPGIALHPAVSLLPGEIASFTPPQKHFAFVIHAAAEVTLTGGDEPYQTLLSGLHGMERVLSFAQSTGASKLLFTSSGAVYGRQPGPLTHVEESYTGAPDPLLPASIYGEVKRLSELMCVTSSSLSQPLECKIARCFAFAGPGLPLDGNFALGNFIRDALADRPIDIKGDGTAVRSYLYAADLAVWLWTILFSAPPLRAYNVGSEASMNIQELALKVTSTLAPGLPVNVHGSPVPGVEPARYIPSTQRARQELGLTETVDIHDSIQRMAAWLRSAR